MSLRKETPCDFDSCPYDAEYHSTCEYWCGAEEPEDYNDFADYPDVDIVYEEEESEDFEDLIPSNFDEDEDGW